MNLKDAKMLKELDVIKGIRLAGNLGSWTIGVETLTGTSLLYTSKDRVRYFNKFETALEVALNFVSYDKITIALLS